MWSLFLSQWNGVSFFLDEDETYAEDLEFYADVTPVSFGGYFQGKWFYGRFDKDLVPKSCKVSLALFELYPIVMAAVLWGNEWCRKRIVVNCNNSASVEIINKRRSKIPFIMKFVRKLVWHQAKHYFIIRAGTSSRSRTNDMSTSFRVDDVLKENVNKLWMSSVSMNTRSVYYRGLQCLLNFLLLSGIIIEQTSLPHLNEDVLIYFVTYCHSNLKLKWATIKLYLAGVRFHYLEAGYENPFHSVDRLQCIIRGIKRSQQSTTKPRLPIDIKVLNDICQLLRGGVLSQNTDKTLECMCLLAYYGFLRCSEFTVQSLNSSCSFLRICDISFSNDNAMFILILNSSKTDPFRKGVQIPYFKKSNLCPVACMLSYIHSCRKIPLQSESPLFVDNFNQPFSRQQFIMYLREILRRLGYKENDYCSHPFRIGAASTAAAAGIEDYLIKVLGRWNSSCYERYIRVAKSSIEDAQNRLSMTS